MGSSKTSLSVSLSAKLVKARRAFFKMTMREKVLALLFAFALLGLWFSWQMDRHQLLGDEHTEARRTENLQDMQLAEGPSIRSDYEARMAQVDLSTLPTKDEASGEIDNLVRRSFSEFDLPEARSEAGTNLDFHTYQLRVNKTSYGKIKQFTEAIKAELPYLSLEKIIISVQARDDNFKDVQYVFKSIEYTK